MKWIPAPPALIKLFDSAVQAFPKAERKRMFGYPSIFVNGHLTAGLFQDRVMIRLSPEDREEVLQKKGYRIFEPMPGKQMKEYVEFPGGRPPDGGTLDKLLAKAVSYTSSLPPKAKKPARKGKTPK
jgi:hypothetical protein